MNEPTALEVPERDEIAHPSDDFLGTALPPAEYKARRDHLFRFIKHQLTEATYGEKGKLDKINDYYKVPGSDKLALSKKGAELLCQHYSYKVMSSAIVA